LYLILLGGLVACGLHITLLHTLEYGHLDRTSDHPAQGVCAPSTPRPVALRSSRFDLRAIAHQHNSDLLHPISFTRRLAASQRQTRRVRCPPTPLPSSRTQVVSLRLGPKAPHNHYTKWDECRPLRKISMCAHRAVPPSPFIPLAVAGELARGVRTDCSAIIFMKFPCNASVDDVLGRA
jgi:hypothetical protein